MKAKYKEGEVITDLSELALQEFVYCHHKIIHHGWFKSWQIRLAERYINRRALRKAVRLTNGEYYSDMSDDELIEMLEETLCEECTLDENLKGVHCYGGEPVMCEGVRCHEALDYWKEKEYEQSN